MQIEATCDTCRRQFTLSQLLPEPGGTDGRCPFCGTRFGRHYVAVLPAVIEETEAAAEALVGSLEKLVGMNPGFKVDISAIFSDLAERLAS